MLPAGLRLRDAVDVAVDVGAPYGDAALDLPGYEPAVCPVAVFAGVGNGCDVSVGLAGCVCVCFARDLNLLALGERPAASLGVDFQRVTLVLLITASLVSAVCVAVSGIIGFVGLLVPHMMRMLAGPDNRRLLPVSMLAGAILLLGADTLEPGHIDYSFKPEKLDKFLDFIRMYYPDLDESRLHPDYTGIRPKLYREGEPVPDFRIDTAAEHGLELIRSHEHPLPTGNRFWVGLFSLRVPRGVRVTRLPGFPERGC